MHHSSTDSLRGWFCGGTWSIRDSQYFAFNFAANLQQKPNFINNNFKKPRRAFNSNKELGRNKFAFRMGLWLTFEIFEQETRAKRIMAL